MHRHRPATLIATASAALAVTAAPALAHTEVKSTSPSKGSTAKRSIRSVTVTFTQAIQSGTLRVTGPGRVVVSSGGGGRDPRKVSRLQVPLRRGLAAGRYKARWTIKAVDGHAQHGTFRFRLG
jgi:methionine-rich copper-binding protein CopC